MKRSTFTAAGAMVIFMASTMADSENLLLPMALVLIGAVLVMIGKRRGEADE